MANSTRLYEQVQNNSEALVMAHLGMVKRVALHLKVRLPPFMELDELIQVGMIGLLEAARAYNPSKGIEFENFAHSRVRGAMLDEVRRLSFLPRSAVAFNKEHNTTVHALAAELGARAHVITCNLGDAAEVEALPKGAAEAMGVLDILVNNAGVTRDNIFMRMSDEEWDQVINVNLTSTMRLCRGVLRGMMKARSTMLGIPTVKR